MMGPVTTLLLLLVAAAGAVAVVVQAADPPVVVTEEGSVSGLKEHSTKGATIYSYRSIPFAKPPTGKLRFKPPLPSGPWEGVRDGTMDPTPCQQVPFAALSCSVKNVTGSEDCLYLNVFTPAEPGSGGQDLPVLVYIHGGAFFCGSASDYRPHVLLNHEVVLVVLQYRLGVLGFLSTEDSVIPGNFGLLDQTMALRWVQRNIGHFGGDPKKVTIFGESAGSASAHYHILSPMTEGLFSRAIMQSGTALSPWAYGGAFREVAEYVGQSMGCPTHLGSQVLLLCLQRADPEALVGTLVELTVFLISPVLLAPRVDGEYLPAEPALLMKEGRQHKVPIISGTTAHEGAMITTTIFANQSIKLALEENFSVVGVTSLEFGMGDGDPQDLATRVFRHYLGGVTGLREENADLINQMYSDRFFNVDQEQVMRLHTQAAATIYTYELIHRGEHSLSRLVGDLDDRQKWVCHADDLLYLFSGGPLLQYFPLIREEDLRLRDVITKLWVNFAATGNPTPDDSLGFTWLPLSQSQSNPNHHHLEMKPTPTMAPDHRQQMQLFWSMLPTKQNLILDPDQVVFREAVENDVKQQLTKQQQQEEGVKYMDYQRQQHQDADGGDWQQNQEQKLGKTVGSAKKKLKIPTKILFRDEL